MTKTTSVDNGWLRRGTKRELGTRRLQSIVNDIHKMKLFSQEYQLQVIIDCQKKSVQISGNYFATIKSIIDIKITKIIMI